VPSGRTFTKTGSPALRARDFTHSFGRDTVIVDIPVFWILRTFTNINSLYHYSNF